MFLRFHASDGLDSGAEDSPFIPHRAGLVLAGLTRNVRMPDRRPVIPCVR